MKYCLLAHRLVLSASVSADNTYWDLGYCFKENNKRRIMFREQHNPWTLRCIACTTYTLITNLLADTEVNNLKVALFCRINCRLFQVSQCEDGDDNVLIIMVQLHVPISKFNSRHLNRWWMAFLSSVVEGETSRCGEGILCNAVKLPWVHDA